MAKKFIQQAIQHPGALTKKATAAGMSPMAYAQAHKHDSGTTGNQARLAVTLNTLNKRSTKGSPPMTKAELAQGYRRLP